MRRLVIAMKRVRRKKGVTWGLPIHHRCLSLSWNGDGTVVSCSHTHTKSLKNAIDFRLKTGSEVLASSETPHLSSIVHASSVGATIVAADLLEPSLTVDDGVVVATASHFSVGGLRQRLRPRANYIAIHHPSIGLYSRYYHLSKDRVLVNVGDNVDKAQVIGLSGNTGYSSGPHLHFDVVQILPQHISCLQYSENGPQNLVETGISTGENSPILLPHYGTWMPIPSIPASFSAPLPSLKERVVLKLVETADCISATALPLSSVAVLVDRDSKTSFQDMCLHS